MRVRAGTILIPLVLLLLAQSTGLAENESRFAICFEAGQAEFQELELPYRIYDRLVGLPGLSVELPHHSDSIRHKDSRFDLDHYEPNMMREMAHALDVRYLIWLKVEEAGIRQTDRTILPYVFRSHQRRFLLGVQMFVLDALNGKTVFSDHLESTRSGPSALSYLDFDSNDPGLAQKYSRVKSKFGEMESELSEKIAENIVRISSRR
jgi:hypothetical protein